MNKYIIYTDGAYSSSRNRGGYAFVILKDNNIVCKYSGSYSNCTNNQMEMMACIVALESIKTASDIVIYTDSMYVVGTYTLNWKRKKNVKLWQRFDKAIALHNKVEFNHVKGHAENKYNNMCDEMAVEAYQ